MGLWCTFGHPHRSVRSRDASVRRVVLVCVLCAACGGRPRRTRRSICQDLINLQATVDFLAAPGPDRDRRRGARRPRQARPDAAGRPRRRRGARRRGQRAARRAGGLPRPIENLGDDTSFAPTARRPRRSRKGSCTATTPCGSGSSVPPISSRASAQAVSACGGAAGASASVSGWSSTLAGDHDVEGGAAALAFVDPRAAAVQLGEPGDERQPDPGAGRVRGSGRALLERLEDRRAELRRDAGPVVLDADAHAAFVRPDVSQIRRSDVGVAHGVHQEVLDDPLHLRRVDGDHDRIGLDEHLPSDERVEMLDRAARERADVGDPVLRLDDPAVQPVDVEQILEEPIELLRVGGEPRQEVVAIGRRRCRARAPASATVRGSMSAGSAARATPPRGRCSSCRRAHGGVRRPRARVARSPAAPAPRACAR